MESKNKSFFFKGKISKDRPALEPITADSLIYLIGNNEKLKEQVKLLRKVLRVDETAYKRQKSVLPFFIGAEFEGNIRRMENLISINAFVIDIDNCFLDLPFDGEIVDELRKDQRIYFMFKSPSGKGLKVVFLLTQPISSPKGYTDFYRSFIYSFSQKYKLEEYVDTVTSDVTRVCFLSFDPDIWHNPFATPIEASDYIRLEENEEIDAEKLKTAAKHKAQSGKKEENSAPDKDQYREILEKLGSRKAKMQPNNIKVPHQLEIFMEEYQDQLVNYGFELEEVINIQYGKKVKVTHKEIWSEINIFYGKRGFSVVLSPKRGSDPALGEVIERLAQEAVAEYHLNQKIETIELKGNSTYQL